MKTAKLTSVRNTTRVNGNQWPATKVRFRPLARNSSGISRFEKLLHGAKYPDSSRQDDEWDDLLVDRKEATLLSISCDTCTFIDTIDSTNYEVDGAEAKAILPFLEEGMQEKCVLVICEDKVITVQPPMIVSRKVAQKETPGLGDTGGKVTARLHNGTAIEVDDSVQVGDMIDIDPSDGSFLGLSGE